MKIQELTLTNVRAFKRAEFEFKPGVNLIVGLNGLGKTTILDVLRILLSQTLPHANEIRGDSLDFTNDDIKLSSGVPADALSAELKLQMPGYDLTYTVHKPRGEYIPKEGGNVRDAVIETPGKYRLIADNKGGEEISKLETETQLGVFFSTRRSLPSDAEPSKRKAGGEKAAAVAGALSHRGLRLREIASWIKVQETLGDERPLALKHLAAVKHAAAKLLPDCRNLTAETGKLFVEKDGERLNVRQLSDGERSLLVLALDLAIRLAQARPDLANPITNADAVVLIDEIDLHLHPQWQRTIIERLTRTFPGCQFITTTHSPFVIQALGNGHLIQLGGGASEIDPSGESIEDIAEAVQGLSQPIRSVRDERLAKATERYFGLLRSKAKRKTKEFAKAERDFREASEGFSTQPGLEAVLKFEALAAEHKIK